MNCKIIATSFSEGRIQTDARFPNHNQDIETQQGKLDMLKQIVKYEMTNDAGVPLDILIVNSDVGFKEGNEWIKTINGTKTLNGQILTITRENVGGSFGAYSDAFNKDGIKRYNNWLFTEDDIIVGGKDYYRRIMNKFRARKNAGFIALVGLSRHPLGTHAHGGVGFTTREILDNICKNNNGELPHYKGGWEKEKVIEEGEVKFTNFIESKIGKEIIVFHDEDEWNLEKKLCIPYYNYYDIH